MALGQAGLGGAGQGRAGQGKGRAGHGTAGHGRPSAYDVDGCECNKPACAYQGQGVFCNKAL